MKANKYNQFVQENPHLHLPRWEDLQPRTRKYAVRLNREQIYVRRCARILMWGVS